MIYMILKICYYLNLNYLVQTIHWNSKANKIENKQKIKCKFLLRDFNLKRHIIN